VSVDSRIMPHLNEQIRPLPKSSKSLDLASGCIAPKPQPRAGGPGQADKGRGRFLMALARPPTEAAFVIRPSNKSARIMVGWLRPLPWGRTIDMVGGAA